MKTITLLLSTLLTTFLSLSQSTKPTNVYPSNLEENIYFRGYDPSSHSITGIHFLVLSDGDNSKDKTPAFEVSLYLMPEGKSSLEDLIIIKTYPLDGIFHMGSHEFKNETIALSGIQITPGRYRLGIWVNSSQAFSEDSNDNATLFNNTIIITKSEPTSPNQIEAPQSETKSSEEEGELWQEDDDEEE